MMHFSSFFRRERWALALAGGVAIAAFPARAAEPYVLTIDGVEHSIILDRKATIQVGDSPHEVSLRKLPYQVFSQSGLQFHFPASYRMKDNVDSWTLTGKSSLIIVHQHEVQDHKELQNRMANFLVSQFGETNVQKGYTTKMFGEHTLNGMRLDSQLGESLIRQDVYAFSTQRATFVLIFQDELQSEGVFSEEAERAQNLLSQSFSLIGKKDDAASVKEVAPVTPEASQETAPAPEEDT